MFQWTPSFKEGGEYPLVWDLAHVLRPNRPHYHPKVGAQVPNSLGELNPYTTASFRMLAGTPQTGTYLVCSLLTGVNPTVPYGTKLTPGLVRMLAAD